MSTVATLRSEATAGGTTEIEAAVTGDAPPGQGRFFLPAGARGVGTRTGSARVDAYGVLLPSRDEPATTVWFSGQGGSLPVAPPGPRDLDVPARLRSVLEPIANEWTMGETTSGARLAAIERHLASGFSYSLDVPRSRGTSPVMDFLLVTRRGHCELFATAMALLGRTEGVPVRVVGGFRVAEHNAIGGYDVVRAKNAHAWVEAWTPVRGWQTFDPTPVTEDNFPREDRGFGAIADAVRGAIVRAVSRLRGAWPWRSVLVLVLAIPALALLGRLSARRLRSRRRPSPPADAPPAYFAALERTLTARGCPRAPGEPLERYAARLRDAALADAADVVLDYAAHRYGGIGDASAIEARARACTGDAARR
jgi:hypothetical protein